jgi:hypothetical protein
VAFLAETIGLQPSDPWIRSPTRLFTSAHGLPWADNCQPELVAGPRR